MDKQLIDLLKQHDIFSSIYDDSDLEALQVESIQLAQGKVLFHQNDPSDHLYILISGKLSTYLTKTTGGIKVLSVISPIEIIGELGVLSGEPRALTAQAITSCELLRIPGNAFQLFCQKHPVVLLETIKPIISRSQRTLKVIAGEDIFKWAVIIPANKDVNLTKFNDTLAHADLEKNDVKLLRDSELQSNEIKNLFPSLEKKYRRILILLESPTSPIGEACLEKASTVYVLANGEATCNIDATVLDIITNRFREARHELILLHADTILLPSNTRHWLEKAKFSLHHHVRIGNDSDYRRLLRFFTGKSIGLILGGGGAKGWLHIGVIKALLEMNIEIDAIGGTSAGAMVGVCLALYYNYREIVEKFSSFTKVAYKITALRNLTLPIVSLFDAKTGTQFLEKTFADIRIEDLWVPFFCISSNLSAQREEVHHSGHIWKKIRMSGSLPGVIPPVVLDGHIHVDGGLVNNLPVDIMKNLLGPHSKIIASKLSSNSIDETKYDFPSILTLGEAILVKSGLKKYKYPPLFDTFLTSLTLGASMKEKQHSLTADILINPDLRAFGMYSLNKKQETKLLELGYQSTYEAMKSFVFLDEK